MDQDLQRLFELHAEVCKTLANPRRLEILHWLRQGKNQLMNSRSCRTWPSPASPNT